jgi:glycosyltransferase involved in cell wall biosynthesis
MLTLVSSFYNEEDGLSSYFSILNGILDFYPQINVVLVNNASIDQTYSLLNKLAAKDPRIIVIDNPTGLGYADGIRAGIRNSPDDHVLIYPGDLQFNIVGIEKILNQYSLCLKLFPKHINIFTYRKIRFDGLRNRVRGNLWKNMIQIFLNMDSNVDPASQLRILCKCCIPDLNTTDFFWDVEIMYELFKSCKISSVIEVDFYPRTHGESSLKGNFLRVELMALSNLLKLKFKDYQTKN